MPALHTCTDHELYAAWEVASPASAELAAICAEMERRGLDEPFPW